jgi:hypothetical protein
MWAADDVGVRTIIMNGYLTRALVALLLAVFLYLQARAVSERPHRRRMFQLAAGALVALAAFNGALSTGVAIGLVQITLAALGVALLIGSIVSLLLSFSSGEMGDQRERVAAAAREYRERRPTNDERRPTDHPPPTIDE